MGVRAVAWIAAVLCGLSLWGLWGFVAKVCLNRGTGYIAFSLISAVGIGIVACAALVFFGPEHGQGITSGKLWFGLLSALSGGVGTIAFYGALERGPASIVAPLIALYPVVTIVLSFLFLQERLSVTEATGIALAIVAALLIAGS